MSGPDSATNAPPAAPEKLREIGPDGEKMYASFPSLALCAAVARKCKRTYAMPNKALIWSTTSFSA
jgi:hypothetical protein